MKQPVHTWNRISPLELGATALIILLLVGLILHGEKAVWARRSHMMISDFKAYAQAVEQFRQKYGRLPGDLDQDGEMDDTDALTELERSNLAFLKLSPFGTAYWIGWIPTYPASEGYASGNAIKVSGVAPTAARLIEQEIDGTPPAQMEQGRKTGKIRYIILERHATLFFLLD